MTARGHLRLVGASPRDPRDTSPTPADDTSRRATLAGILLRCGAEVDDAYPDARESYRAEARALVKAGG